MVNLQMERDRFFQMPNNKVEKILLSFLCKLGEIEEEHQCNLSPQKRIGCAAHVKGLLPDSNIELLQRAKTQNSCGQKVCASFVSAAEWLKSYNNQDTHNYLDKTRQRNYDHPQWLKSLQDILYLLCLIIHRISNIFQCIFLHKYVSPCQCPYIKTCPLILAQKKEISLRIKPKLKPVKPAIKQNVS